MKLKQRPVVAVYPVWIDQFYEQMLLSKCLNLTFLSFESVFCLHALETLVSQFLSPKGPRVDTISLGCLIHWKSLVEPAFS